MIEMIFYINIFYNFRKKYEEGIAFLGRSQEVQKMFKERYGRQTHNIQRPITIAQRVPCVQMS